MMSAVPKPTAKRAVRIWLATHSKTQQDLACELEISESLLSTILSGRRMPTDELADKIQRKTGIDLRDFHQGVGAA